MPNVFIAGIDSELGGLIGDHLEALGWSVYGTTRRPESVSDSIFYLEAEDLNSIEESVVTFLNKTSDWDLVIIAIGMLNPIGKLTEINFDLWRASIEINFVNQIYLLKTLLKYSTPVGKKKRKILTFAGSGTNSAPINFSAYTISKIALIKSTEILAAEFPNYVFLSVGTGWMKSRIHNQTLEAGTQAGEAYVETKKRLANDNFGKPSLLLDFIDWYLKCDNENISGRNIALQGDDWKAQDFISSLTSSIDSYKLRKMT
jgi:NAD(P)-dependent dehydrogenase (short-subunit alcohol dehydrogenase family)